MSLSADQLRFVTEAEVYKNGALAATLKRTASGATTFAYHSDYIEGPGPAIATTLPRSSDPITLTNGALPPFFTGLLPEGHRLSVLQRAVKTSANDELSLLLAVGKNTPGDVQIVPSGEAPTEPASLLPAARADSLDFLELANGVDQHSLPGVQIKASASIISTPLATGEGRYILKLTPPEYPALIENEAAHLTAAHGLKLAVARANLIADRNGVGGLLVQRFDRVHTPRGWDRLALEDASQVMGIYPAAKYTVSSEEAVIATAAVTTAPLLAARALYLQLVFAWLTGNGDLHAKNFSVLEHSPGRWRTAPIYDIPCTLLYGDDSMALSLAGRTRNLKARHWREFALAIGLPLRAATSANALALSAAAQVDLRMLPITGSPLNSAQRELRFRRAEIGG